MNIIRFTFLALICVALEGCATTDKVVFDNTQRASTSDIDVFKDGQKPNQAYKTIAELSYLGPREDDLKALTRFIPEAKKLGGNGLIFRVEYAGIKGGGTVFQTTAWVFKGKIVVYESTTTNSSLERNAVSASPNGESKLADDLMGHWESIEIQTSHPQEEITKMVFDFMPGNNFIASTSKTGGVPFEMRGRFSVTREKIILSSPGVAEDSMGYSKVDEHLVISHDP
jgi:hypothetical protein